MTHPLGESRVFWPERSNGRRQGKYSLSASQEKECQDNNVTMENNVLPKLQRVLLLSLSGLPGGEWHRRLSEVLDALRHQ